MSELELKNIVGFKAIDADGNEQQVTVDEMVGLVSARIVSAVSEISTFEAAAEAGTDEFEDQLTVSDTFSWLRTMDGSKNPTLTSSTAAAKVLGGLIPLATAGKNGLMSISDKRRMGRNFSKGYWKLAESKVWYNHYGALIYGASPASTRGVLLAVCWAGIDYSANRLSGFNGNVRLYIGDNPDTGNHELWLGLTGEDGTSSEFIVKDGTIIDWGAVKVESLPSYLNEMSIS